MDHEHYSKMVLYYSVVNSDFFLVCSVHLLPIPQENMLSVVSDSCVLYSFSATYSVTVSVI